ncbi:hypothetical protein JHK86_024799 [Glycine max]|nr:hypothetical protein JHK86_024799 [Glycine max]
MQDTLREIKEAKLSGDMPQPFSTDTEISGYLFDFLFAVQEASTSLLLWTVALLELHAELLAKVREMTLRWWHLRWRDKAATYQFTITPRVKSVLDKIVEDGRYCVVTHGGNDEYQVKNEFTDFVVKLKDSYCRCKYWQITCLPCKHASTCIAYKRDKFEKYCHRMFSISMLIFAYAGIIHPMHELDVTNTGGYPNINAPALKRMTGRPTKAREKIHVERPSGTQEAKRSNTLRCSTCNEFAHNSWICQWAPKSTVEGATGGEAIPIDPNATLVAATQSVQAENTDPNSTSGQNIKTSRAMQEKKKPRARKKVNKIENLNLKRVRVSTLRPALCNLRLLGDTDMLFHEFGFIAAGMSGEVFDGQDAGYVPENPVSWLTMIKLL